MQIQTVTRGRAVICSFPGISPISTVSEGIRLGRYIDHYRFITDKTVPLQSVTRAKNLHIVCFNRTIGEPEYVELLRAEDLRPCQDAPQYLLGLMAAVSQERMPGELRIKNLVAAEPDNESSFFADGFGGRCFLGVDWCVGGYSLCLVRVGKWDFFQALLAEYLVPVGP
jgi:hypothetical protein